MPKEINIRLFIQKDFQRLCQIHDPARQEELDLANLSEAFIPLSIAAIVAGSSVGKIGGAMIGQALIPIPGVGAAIGVAVGSIAGGFIGSAINNHLDSGVKPQKRGWSWPW